MVATMQAGALVSDEVVNRMVEERLTAGCRDRVLFWTVTRGRWTRRSILTEWLEGAESAKW